MDQALQDEVWERAGAACEYCRMPQALDPLPFQIDHIIAEQHGGETESANLALACLSCERENGRFMIAAGKCDTTDADHHPPNNASRGFVRPPFKAPPRYAECGLP